MIASVIADALGERTYEDTLEQLTMDGLGTIWERLSFLRKLDEVWWISPFSINHHASICHTPSDADSHGLSFQKAQSFDTEHCDMDELNDMMNYMHATVPMETGHAFKHIVSCDVEFQVFSRLWCVAEVVLAFKQNIDILLLVHSESALNEHARQIKSLDVRMSATSRPEDKDMILARIPCVGNFNQALQDLLLGSDHGVLGQIRTEFVQLSMILFTII